MVDLEIPEVYLERVREVYRRAGYSSVSAFVTDAVRHHLATVSPPDVPWDDDQEDCLRKAKAIVPQSEEREHLHTGESFTVDADLETRFVAMVIDVLGQSRPNRAQRWARPDFMVPPSDRDPTMRAWTRLTVKDGQLDRADLERWDLPVEWLKGLE